MADPEYRLADRKSLAAIDKAIDVAYDFALGTPPNEKFLNRIMIVSSKAHELAPEVQFDQDRLFHIALDRHMAASALNAAQSALYGTWAELLHGRPEFQLSISGSVLAAFHAIKYGIGIRQDFE